MNETIEDQGDVELETRVSRVSHRTEPLSLKSSFRFVASVMITG